MTTELTAQLGNFDYTRSSLLNKLGWIGVLLFVACALETPEYACIGLLALTLAACFSENMLNSVSRVLLFPVIFSLWVIYRAVSRFLEYPAELDFILQWTVSYLVAGGLPAVFVALFLAGDRRRAPFVLDVALIALLAILLEHSGRDAIARYWLGERAYYGLGGAAGYFLNTAILGLLLLVPWGRFREHRISSLGSFSLCIASGALLLFFLVALRWHQNRMAILSMAVIYPVVFGCYLRWRWMNCPSVRPGRDAFIALLLLLTLAVALVGNQVLGRFSQINDITERTLSLSENTPLTTSTDIRIRLLQIGLENLSAHWLIGAGPGFVKQTLQEHFTGTSYPDVHNLYLQLLLEIGLVGLVLYALILISFMRYILSGFWQSPDFKLRLFVAGSMGLYIFSTLTQVRISATPGMYFVTLLYSYALMFKLQQVKASVSTRVRDD